MPEPWRNTSESGSGALNPTSQVPSGHLSPDSHRDRNDSDDERRRLLSAFLTLRRSCIDPTVPALGEHLRRIEAVGNLVTPHEIADAAGINRRWYELAERGEPTRASAAVLHSLALVLGLNSQERAVLAHLATPHVERENPRDESLEMRDAFGSLRDYLRKLYACSTMDEVLSLLQDTAASHFPEATYLATVSRLPDGGWAFQGEAIAEISRRAAFANNMGEVVAPILASDPAGAGLITCFPEKSLPGDLITYSDHDELRLARILGKEYAGFKQLHGAMLAAVIRTRLGFVGHLYLGDFRKSYDEVDGEFVSAIVDFASLVSVP
jgi:transcriptional regulator with XRE-family HTH domain